MGGASWRCKRGDYLPPLRILPRWWEREGFGARIYLKSPTTTRELLRSYGTSSFLKRHILVIQVGKNKISFLLKVRWRVFITLFKTIWVLKINKTSYGKLRNQRQKTHVCSNQPNSRDCWGELVANQVHG